MSTASLGSKIKAARQAVSLSQTALAELVGSTQSAIARLEAGATRPTTATLERIANALNLQLQIELEPSSKIFDAGATCFVIGPIGNRLASFDTEARVSYDQAIEVLEEVITPACVEVGLKPVRADQIHRPGEIGDQIVRQLRDADVVIADLSGANPNVMYELGLRHSTYGITIPLIEMSSNLPFDIRAFRTIQFKRTEAGLVRARRDLREALRSAALEGYDAPTATRVWFEHAMPDLSQTPAVDSLTEVLDEDHELGVAELLAEMEGALPELNTTTGELSAETQAIGNLTREATARLKQSDAAARGFRGRMAIYHWYGQELDQHTSTMDALADQFAEKARPVARGLDAFFDLLRQTEEKGPELDGFIESVGFMVRNIAAARESTQDFFNALETPRQLSSTLRPRIGRLRSALSRIISSMREIEEAARPANDVGRIRDR